MLFLGADTDARFNKLGHQLMCMCGCNQVLLECNHVGCTYSDRMRNELIAGLERGDSDSLVLQSFVQKYGNTVLAAPTTTGFNRVAWIMPFAVFAAALALTIWLVRLWKSRAVAQPVPRPNSTPPNSMSCARRRGRRQNFDVLAYCICIGRTGDRVRALRMRAVCRLPVRLRLLSAGRG